MKGAGGKTEHQARRSPRGHRASSIILTLQMESPRPREGQWLAQEDTAEAETCLYGLCSLPPDVRLGPRQRPKLGFCFTGQVLIKSATLKPGLLILGCVGLLQRSFIATFSIVFLNEANLNLPFRKKYFLLHGRKGGVGGVRRR